MAQLLGRHELSLYPDYGLVTLGDRDKDAAVGADEAVAAAYRDVAAATDYELYIIRAEESLPIHLGVEVWDAEPGTAPTGSDWHGPRRFMLDCPSGEMRLGDNTGAAISGIYLPRPAGRYLVDLFDAGRDEARQLVRELAPASQALPLLEQKEFLEARGAGTERYLLRVWWSEDLPMDDND